MRKMAAWIMAVLLLCGSFGCAVGAETMLKRGSKGQEVTELQEMLIELGFLNDKADGIFGRNTEKAATAYQLWSTGKKRMASIDEDGMNALRTVYALAVNGSCESSDQDLSGMESACIPAEEGEAVYCWQHAPLYRAANFAADVSRNPPVRLRCLMAARAKEQWTQAILDLYDEWAQTAPAVAKEQRQVYLDALAEKESEWAAATADWKGDSAKMADYLVGQEVSWLREIGVNLCFDLHGMEANEGR